MRVKKDGKSGRTLDALDHQLSGKLDETIFADATADTSIEVVTPFEREKVAREVLRAFDSDNNVQTLRRTSALIRVRREAVSYTLYVADS